MNERRRNRLSGDRFLSAIRQAPASSVPELAKLLDAREETLQQRIRRCIKDRLLRQRLEIAPEKRKAEWLTGIVLERSAFRDLSPPPASPTNADGSRRQGPPAEKESESTTSSPVAPRENRFASQAAYARWLLKYLRRFANDNLAIQDVVVVVGSDYDMLLFLCGEGKAVGDLVTGPLTGLRGIHGTHTMALHYRASDEEWKPAGGDEQEERK